MNDDLLRLGGLLAFIVMICWSVRTSSSGTCSGSGDYVQLSFIWIDRVVIILRDGKWI